MSHRAIAAALALEDVSGGERLAAFSLASFADREQRAWPGTRLAAARAGLSRSQYLVALRSLSDRGLVEIEDSDGGRGRSALVRLLFADAGDLVDAEINAQLFEAVISDTRAKGSARTLLAALAALSAPDGGVDELSTEMLCSSAGVSERTYRRACAQLRKDGLVRLERAGGGRGRMNRWVVSDPRQGAAPVAIRAVARRPSVPRGARPLVAPVPAQRPVRDAGATFEGSYADTPGQNRTVSAGIPGQSRTVSNANPCHGRTVSRGNPGQSRTASTKTPAETPAETPAPDARAGRESQNQGTSPPDPPEGGQPGSVLIAEAYTSPRGRRRVRTVHVDPAVAARELLPLGQPDHAAWRQLQAGLRRRVGDARFEIWIAPVFPVAVSAVGHELLLDGPAPVRTWIAQRFADVFAEASEACGCSARIASDRELALLTALSGSPGVPAVGVAGPEANDPAVFG